MATLQKIQCTHCRRKYTRSEKLKEHMESAHGEPQAIPVVVQSTPDVSDRETIIALRAENACYKIVNDNLKVLLTRPVITQPM